MMGHISGIAYHLPERVVTNAELAGDFPGWTAEKIGHRPGMVWAMDLDVRYVDNWLLWLDLKIIWLTAWKVLSREGVSAANEATMRAFTGTPSSPNVEP